MQSSKHAVVAGASTPRSDNADGANVGEVGLRFQRTGRYCDTARRVDQVGAVQAQGGNVSTRAAQCLCIRQALRRVGHMLLARDDGMWIVRTGKA